MPAIARPRRLVAATAATLALVLPLALGVAPGLGASRGGRATAVPADATSHVGQGCSATPGYGWPVRPFHSPHAIRGAFGDPRVGLDASGTRTTSSFHFGVDVVA